MTRAPLVPYVKNVGGVFQGEEDFRPCYLASAVDPMLDEVREGLQILAGPITECPPALYQQWLDDEIDLNFWRWQAQRLLAALKGRTA